MRRLLFITLILVCGCKTPLTAAEEPSLAFAQATSAMESGDTATAIASFEKLVAADWHASELYHNLGVAYQRQGNETIALLQLYRAWLLDPFSDTAKSNFVKLASESQLSSTRLEQMEHAVAAMGLRGPLAIAGLLVFWSGLFALLLTRRPFSRGLGIAGITIGLFIGIAAYYFHRAAPTSETAWVTSTEAVPLRSSHGKGAPKLTTIAPLTQVYTTTQRDNWAYVRTETGTGGWLPSTEFGRLMPWR